MMGYNTVTEIENLITDAQARIDDGAIGEKLTLISVPISEEGKDLLEAASSALYVDAHVLARRLLESAIADAMARLDQEQML